MRSIGKKQQKHKKTATGKGNFFKKTGERIIAIANKIQTTNDSGISALLFGCSISSFSGTKDADPNRARLGFRLLFQLLYIQIIVHMWRTSRKVRNKNLCDQTEDLLYTTFKRNTYFRRIAQQIRGKNNWATVESQKTFVTVVSRLPHQKKQSKGLTLK